MELQRSTFRSKADRSGGAIRSEGNGMESAQDAARRFKIRPWKKLERAGDMYQGEHQRIEYHHLRLREGVESVDYRPPEAWEAIAADLKVLYAEWEKWA